MVRLGECEVGEPAMGVSWHPLGGAVLADEFGKSSFSVPSNDACLAARAREQDGMPSGIEVSDTKANLGPRLVFPPGMWDKFLATLE